MSGKILVVEDDPDIQELVCYNLQQAGLETIAVEGGEAAIDRLEVETVEMIVLDLMLPGMDGLEVCRWLKQQPQLREIPVLMLTARAEEVDRIVGLELGADDYVVKPFSPRELVLRVRAVLRRAEGRDDDADGDRIQAGPLLIDAEGHQVFMDGKLLELTTIEFKLLKTLAQRRGRVQTRDELLNVVWGYEYGGYARTVDTHVRRLREKLDAASSLVETVRGVGYRFKR